MKLRRTVSLLIVGAGVMLLSVGSQAQEVRDFTTHEPTQEELLDALKPRKPTSRGIKEVTTTPSPPSGKLQCAYYRKQISRGVTLLPESNAAALNITFAYNSAELTPESTETLNTLGAVLQSNDLESCCFRVEGHTDSKGSDSYNKKLSQRRAQSVARYLSKRMGITPDRLLAMGYGEAQPLADNDTDDGRQKNRRVQIVNLGYGQPAE